MLEKIICNVEYNVGIPRKRLHIARFHRSERNKGWKVLQLSCKQPPLFAQLCILTTSREWVGRHSLSRNNQSYHLKMIASFLAAESCWFRMHHQPFLLLGGFHVVGSCAIWMRRRLIPSTIKLLSYDWSIEYESWSMSMSRSWSFLNYRN